MLTTGGMFGVNDESNAVIRKLQGHRTVAQRVMEYYGLQKEDLVKAKKLKEMGVKHTERLAQLGVSKQQFEALFEDILDFTEDEPSDESGKPGAGESVGKRARNAKK